jgi:hypothetical protein
MNGMCPAPKKVKDKEEKVLIFPRFKFVMEEKTKGKKLNSKLSFGSEYCRKNLEKSIDIFCSLHI